MLGRETCRLVTLSIKSSPPSVNVGDEGAFPRSPQSPGQHCSRLVGKLIDVGPRPGQSLRGLPIEEGTQLLPNFLQGQQVGQR